MGRVVLLCSLILGGCSHWVASSSPAVQGIWLDDMYVRTLKRLSSPKAAFGASEYPVLIIDERSLTVRVIINFHEAGEAKIVGADTASGQLLLSNADEGIEESADNWIQSLTVAGGKAYVTYRDSNGGSQLVAYSRISTASDGIDEVVDDYVATLILTGKYRDRENEQAYLFDTRTANWNGRQFNYRISLDYVEFAPMDRLCEIDAKGLCKVAYGFATNGGQLQIYEYDDDSHMIGRLIHYLILKGD